MSITVFEHAVWDPTRGEESGEDPEKAMAIWVEYTRGSLSSCEPSPCGWSQDRSRIALADSAPPGT